MCDYVCVYVYIYIHIYIYVYVYAICICICIELYRKDQDRKASVRLMRLFMCVPIVWQDRPAMAAMVSHGRVFSVSSRIGTVDDFPTKYSPVTALVILDGDGIVLTMGL